MSTKASKYTHYRAGERRTKKVEERDSNEESKSLTLVFIGAW